MTRGKTKTPAPGRTEAQVSQQIVEAAAVLGVVLDRRNTGVGVNPAGKSVRFGTPGDSDYTGVLPGGRRLDVEVKRESFDPAKLRGAKKAHFDRQLARLKNVNDLGGVAFWASDSGFALTVLRHVLAGARVAEPGYGPLEVIYPNGEEPK